MLVQDRNNDMFRQASYRRDTLHIIYSEYITTHHLNPIDVPSARGERLELRPQIVLDLKGKHAHRGGLDPRIASPLLLVEVSLQQPARIKPQQQQQQQDSQTDIA